MSTCPHLVGFLFVWLMAMTGVCQGAPTINRFCPIASVNNNTLDLDRLAGTWFLKMEASDAPNALDPRIFEVELTVEHDQGKTYVGWNEAYVKRGETTCNKAKFTLEPMGAFLYNREFGTAYKSVIVAVHYSSIFALWSEFGTQGALGIFIRNRDADADLSLIRSDLQKFCGANAANAASGFYNKIMNYDENAPSCRPDSA